MDLSKSARFGIYQVLVIGLIGIYVESVASGKILFIGELLSTRANQILLNNSLTIIILLGILNVTFYFLSHYNRSKALEKKLYSRICKHIFNEFIRNDSRFENSDCKVSFLKVGLHYKMFKVMPCVSVFGRHQTKQGSENSKVKFYKNEGCAGTAYALNLIVNKTINKYDSNNETIYYDDCINMLNLPVEKAKRLNEKPASCVCIPITYFETDKVMGVLSIDSLKGTPFDDQMVRNIELSLKNYQAIFHNE